MAKDIGYDDDYEMDDFDSLFGESQEAPPPPPTNAREAVSYTASEITKGMSDGMSPGELRSRLGDMSKSFSPKRLDKEMGDVARVRDLVSSQASEIVTANKDSIKGITSLVKSKTKSGSILNRIASSIEDKVTDHTSSVEDPIYAAARIANEEYDRASEQANSEAIIKQNLGQQEALNSIYTTLLQGDIFTKNITSHYYRKSLEYQLVHLTTSKAMLDVQKEGFNKINSALGYVVKNTGLPDVVKVRNTEAMMAEARNRAVGDAYGKYVGNGGIKKILRKITNSRGKVDEALSRLGAAADGLNTASEMNDMMGEMTGQSATRMMGGQIPGFLGGLISKQLGSMFAKTKHGRSIVDGIRDAFDSPGEALGDMGEKLQGGGYFSKKLGSGLKSLSGFLDDDDGGSTDRVIDATKLSEAAVLDNRTLLTQNEVVPGLLSKILAEVTMIRTKSSESEELKYDYTTRSFSTTKGMTDKLNRNISSIISTAGGASDVMSLSKYILNASGTPYDNTKLGMVRNGITTFMLSGKSFKPTKIDDGFLDYFTDDVKELVRNGIINLTGENAENASINKSHLRDAFSTARAKIPNIDQIIEGQMDLGNIDVLEKAGLVTRDFKTGRVTASKDGFHKKVESTYAQYSGEGYDITPDYTEEEDLLSKVMRWTTDIKGKAKSASEFKDRVDTNLSNSDMTVRAHSNKPMVGSLFTINKSGTNSEEEKMATDALRKASEMKRAIKESELYKATSAKVDTTKEAIKNTELYKSATKELTKLGIKLDLTNVTAEDMKTIHGFVNTTLKAGKGSAREIEYESGIRILEFLKSKKLISEKTYLARLTQLEDRYTSVEANTYTDIDIQSKVDTFTTEAKSIREQMTKENLEKKGTEYYKNVSDYAGELKTKEGRDKAVNDIKGIVDGTLDKVTASELYTKMTKAIDDYTNGLGLSGVVSKLDKKHILELYTIILSTPKGDRRAAVLAYLHLNDIDADKLLTTAEETLDEVTDGTKAKSLKDRLFDYVTNNSLINSLKTIPKNDDVVEPTKVEPTEEESATITPLKPTEKSESEIKKEEDSRTEKIITGVLDKLGKKEKKNKANDKDGDGIRDGGWMDMFKRKGKKEPNEKDAKAKLMPDKKDGTLMGILKMLMMGLPLIWTYLKSVVSVVTTVAGFAKHLISLPGIFNAVVGAGKLLGGLAGKLGGVLGKFLGKVPAAAGVVGGTAAKIAKATMGKGKWFSSLLGGAGGKLLGKIPLIGGLAMGAKGIYEMSQGDFVGGLGSIASGLVAQIPFAGIPLAFGVDYLVDKYKDSRGGNVSVDKALYSNDQYPTVSMDAGDTLTLEHIRKQETGTKDGKYAIAANHNDQAGISFGAYQLTENSGNIKKYVAMLYELTKDPKAKEILDRFKGNKYGGNPSELIGFLKATGDTNAGRYVQDSIYKESFVRPAKNLAAKYGITNPASISQVVDHAVNAGLGGANRMLGKAGGDFTPTGIAKARKLDYLGIIAGNPLKGKYKKAWLNRVDANSKLFAEYKDPNKDTIVDKATLIKEGVSDNGKPITPITPVTIDGVTPPTTTSGLTPPTTTNPLSNSHGSTFAGALGNTPPTTSNPFQGNTLAGTLSTPPPKDPTLDPTLVSTVSEVVTPTAPPVAPVVSKVNDQQLLDSYVVKSNQTTKDVMRDTTAVFSDTNIVGALTIANGYLATIATNTAGLSSLGKLSGDLSKLSGSIDGMSNNTPKPTSKPEAKLESYSVNGVSVAKGLSLR